MQIFHGSENIIEKPLFGFGNPKNDYGLGFYCTQSNELAKEWVCHKNKDGYSNCYELETKNLSVLDLSDSFSPKSPLGKQNLDFLISNYQIDYTEYDVIIGYRANDSYFSFASDFLENIIPIQSLATSMQLGSLGVQVVLKSKKAFEIITYCSSEKADCKLYYPKYKTRDTNARKSYLENLRNQKPEESTYLIDIVRNPELLNELHL